MAVVLTPATEGQLRDYILFALAQKTPVDIVGAGSKRALGRPVEAAQQLSTRGLYGIDLYEPEELVMTVRAGTPLAHVEAALATHHQQLAFEPADYGPLLGRSANLGTIGGVIACNLAGPRRVKAGAARDHFLGVTCVTGRGEIVKSGGRVVKNVTGYDLCKLLAGSHGTLAAMTSITVKVLPAPEDTRTLLLHGLDDRDGIAALTAALQSAHEVSGAAHLPASVAKALQGPILDTAGAALTAVRLEGFAPSVSARVAALREILGRSGEITLIDAHASVSFWRQVRDALPFALQQRSTLWRLSVPPASGLAIADSIRTSTQSDIYYDWGGGLLWVSVADSCEDGGAASIRSAIRESSGHATLIRAADELRRRVPVFQPQEPGLALLSRRVRDAFDPHRILNRGRIDREP